jgi:hypothetical protein
MKLGRAFVFSLILSVGMLMTPSAIVFADSPSSYCTYVAETGHNIHGAFLLFYRSHNGTTNFGLPLTEAFSEKGRLVQYFERARLEFFPENPPSLQVQVGMLGLEYYNITDPPIRIEAIPPRNNPNFLYFEESGQMISFALKEAFDKYGGRELLGYPVSGIRYESGKFVQYFQRQRLVWDPLTTGANKVVLSPVGQLALDKNYPADFKWRARVPNDYCGTPPIGPTPTTVPFVIPTPNTNGLAMTLHVRVRFRQTGTVGPQYVDVIVEDQNQRRLTNIAAYAVVYLANGERYFPLLPTNSSGITTFGFELGNQPRNCAVTVEVTAFAGPLSATGRDTFTCQ